MNGFHFNALLDWSWLLLLDCFSFRFFIWCDLEIITLDCAGVVELLWGLILTPIHSWELNIAYETTASCSGSSLPSLLTLSITVSGIGMASQLRRTIFFIEFKLINLYPPCKLPLGPRQMAPFVRGNWLFLGVSSS